MKLDIGDRSELQEYLASQLEHFFPDKYKFKGNDIDIAMKLALERLENCFKYINIPAYSDNKGQTFFSYLHSDQYAHFYIIFLIVYGKFHKISQYVIN